MKSSGQDEMNIATLMTYGLVMGMLETFAYGERRAVMVDAIGKLPPDPDQTEDPTGYATAQEARKRLKALLP